MNKLSVMALSLVLAGGMLAGCSGNKQENADSDSVTIDAMAADTAAVASDSAETATDTVAAATDTKKEAADPYADFKVTKSGLKYKVIKAGTGNSPKATDEVTVHYTGKLLNGQVFDSSVSRGEPATFPLNRVIPGWTEGLQLMKEGGKTIFYIPSALAYGAAGAPPVIGPDEDLIFEVELIKVGR